MYSGFEELELWFDVFDGFDAEFLQFMEWREFSIKFNERLNPCIVDLALGDAVDGGG